jgi:hypothetical protein
MNVKHFLTELHRRNPILSATGWAHILILLGAGIGLVLDPRQILGQNPWIKPAKFAISIFTFVWTMAWLLEYLPNYRRAIRRISWGISISMFIEILCICLQSLRGVPSHFNRSSPLDAIIFGTMGVSILLNAVFTVVVLYLFFRHTPARSAIYIWGIRLGIIIFIASGFIGNDMVSRLGHTVGGEDGGPGLPAVNWSTEAGDLRIAHAVGLHALQLLPLIGFQLKRSRLPERSQKMGV